MTAVAPQTPVTSSVQKEHHTPTPVKSSRKRPRTELVWGNKVGSGVTSTVYHGTWCGRDVALKRVAPEDGMRCHALREISILRMLGSHPHIIRLEDVVPPESPKDPITLVLQPYTPTTLRDGMRGGVTTDQARRWFRQLLCAVAHAHARGVFHRDLKPSNILVHDGNLVVCDWGHSRAVVDTTLPMTGVVTTLWYRAPESLLGATHHGEAADLWSVACIAAELFYGQPLVQNMTEHGVLLRIFQRFGTPTPESWPGCTQLPHWKEFPKFPGTGLMWDAIPSPERWVLQHLLQLDPVQRLSTHDALQALRPPVLVRQPRIRIHPWRERERRVPDPVPGAKLNPQHRAALIDWLASVVVEFDLRRGTLCLAVRLMDAFTALHAVQRNDLQKVASAALLLASKWNDVLSMSVDVMVKCADGAFDAEELLHTEWAVATMLAFDVGRTTPWTLLGPEAAKHAPTLLPCLMHPAMATALPSHVAEALVKETPLAWMQEGNPFPTLKAIQTCW